MPLPSDGVRRPVWPRWQDWYGGAVRWVDDNIFGRLGGLPWPLSTAAGWVQSAFDFLAGFLDTAFGFVLGVGNWTFDQLATAIFDLARAADSAYYLAIGVAQNLVDRALSGIGTAADLLDRVYEWLWPKITGFVADAVGALRDAAWSLFLHAIATAQQLVDDLRSWTGAGLDFVANAAHQLVDDLRSWTAAGLDFVGHAAHMLFDQAVQLVHDAIDAAVHELRAGLDFVAGAARDALDLFRRDVLDPVAGALQSFIDNEWHWAMNLLKVLEDAAEWLVWIGEHVVPEAVATYRAIRDVIDAPAADVAQWGVAIGAGF